MAELRQGANPPAVRIATFLGLLMVLISKELEEENKNRLKTDSNNRLRFTIEQREEGSRRRSFLLQPVDEMPGPHLLKVGYIGQDAE